MNIAWLKDKGGPKSMFKFKGNPITMKYITGQKTFTDITGVKSKYAFIGEHNQDNLPDGFVRIIDELGNITEGYFTPDGHRNGFCVKTSSITKSLFLGIYENDKVVGEFMDYRIGMYFDKN